MIKREHIKQAIEAIASRDPDIGYSLDEMLGMGLIDIPSDDEGREGDNFLFLFGGEKVLVNRVLFFNEGTVPIEQRLLIKYGELAKKQELQDRGDSRSFRDAFSEIHRAGLRTAVIHEIDYATARLRKSEGDAGSANREREELAAFLQGLKGNGGGLEVADDHPAVLYRGTVDTSTPAYFMPFPVSMDGLMQVADLNMEFFHVRFVINCLIRGVERNLLACVSGGNILGLVFLGLREQFFKKDLEIKYLATLRGKSWESETPGFKVPKGVGTFLVAGVWLLWKNAMSGLKEIVLDSELGARHFYESIGFVPRGLAGYALKEPKGYLLRAILMMTHDCRELRNETIEEIRNLIGKQIKKLRKKNTGDKAAKERKAAFDALIECMKPGAKKEFAEAVCRSLAKHREKIPESREILRFAMEHGSDEVKACISHAASSDR